MRYHTQMIELRLYSTKQPSFTTKLYGVFRSQSCWFSSSTENYSNPTPDKLSPKQKNKLWHEKRHDGTHNPRKASSTSRHTASQKEHCGNSRPNEKKSIRTLHQSSYIAIPSLPYRIPTSSTQQLSRRTPTIYSNHEVRTQKVRKNVEYNNHEWPLRLLIIHQTTHASPQHMVDRLLGVPMAPIHYVSGPFAFGCHPDDLVEITSRKFYSIKQPKINDFQFSVKLLQFPMRMQCYYLCILHDGW